MTTTISFPLLKLPSVPLDEVLKSMSLQELAPLAVVSDKANKIVKSLVKHKSYELKIYLNSENLYMFLFCTNGETYNFISVNSDFYSFEESVASIKMDTKEHCEFTIRNNSKEQFELLLSNVNNAFNPEITLNLDSCDESLVSKVLDVIKKLNITLKKAHIGGFEQSDQIFQKFLEVSSRSLKLRAYPKNRYFQYESSDGPMKFDSLFIDTPDYWAKFEYFLNCKNVFMSATELRIHDLIQFLKKWMTSDSPLEILKVQMNRTEFPSIGNVLSLTPIQKFDTRNNGYQEFKGGHCFGLQRIDGKKAIIYHHLFYATFETVR